MNDFGLKILIKNILNSLFLVNSLLIILKKIIYFFGKVLTF